MKFSTPGIDYFAEYSHKNSNSVNDIIYKLLYNLLFLNTTSVFIHSFKNRKVIQVKKFKNKIYHRYIILDGKS